MNQILSMQQSQMSSSNGSKQKKPKKEKQINYGRPSNKANIVSISRVFCVLIILFGLVLIGDATYGIVSSKPTLKDTINVTANAIGSDVTIKAVGSMPIQRLTYKWGQGEEIVIQGNGTVELEAVTQIPRGNNILNMTVIDYYGNKAEFQKQYINEQDDSSKPSIEISVSGNMLNIIATDETEMSYLTYSWNNETPTRVNIDSNATDKRELRTSIEVQRGENTLDIVAVDVDGNTATRTENIKGANKPTFEVSADGTNLIINAKDDEGINKIEITVDGAVSETEPDNLKKLQATLPITPGDHTVTIKVTNVNGLSTEQSFNVSL